MTDSVPPGEVRATHDDRDRAADMLRIAAGNGQLTADELDERLEKALTARTVGELALLTRDLSVMQRDVLRIHREGGNARRDGRWVVPRLIEVHVGWGHVVLDFTDAVITQPRVHIDAAVRSGTLTLLTRPGIDVDADDVQVRSSGSVKIRLPRRKEVLVILRIEIGGTVQTGHLRVRPGRRLFRRGAAAG